VHIINLTLEEPSRKRSRCNMKEAERSPQRLVIPAVVNNPGRRKAKSKKKALDFYYFRAVAI
jgi:hypothetical protein